VGIDKCRCKISNWLANRSSFDFETSIRAASQPHAAHTKRIIVRHRLPAIPRAALRAARSLMAALLVCVTLASATRADALLAASQAAMDCCKGGAMKDSCPFMGLKGARRAELIPAEPKASDPVCHARATLRGRATRAALQAVSTRLASSRSSSSVTPVTSVTRAKLSSTDCCCRTISPTRTTRMRDEATLAHKSQPRPPTPLAAQSLARFVAVVRDEVRRQHPPRAPPASL
jgi:hypothetical protein